MQIKAFIQISKQCLCPDKAYAGLLGATPIPGNICMTDELRGISLFCLVFEVINFNSGFIKTLKKDL